MINPKDFLDTPEELHALTLGLCEVVCPWPPREATMDKEIAQQVWTEYHYYVLGRAIGILSWIGIAALIKEIFF